MLIFNNTNDLITLLLDSFCKWKSIFYIVHYNDAMPTFTCSIMILVVLFFIYLDRVIQRKFLRVRISPITLASQDHRDTEKQVKIDMLKNGCQVTVPKLFSKSTLTTFTPELKWQMRTVRAKMARSTPHAVVPACPYAKVNGTIE